MAVKKKTKPSDAIAAIRKALDGRSQRWLAFKTGIGEPDLSNKLNGVRDFSTTDKKAISEALNISL